jgi:hypothetical protein
MNVVRVYGIPPTMPNGKKWVGRGILENLEEEIKHAVARASKTAALDETSVFFPFDLKSYGLGNKLCAEVVGIFHPDALDKGELLRLAMGISEALADWARVHLPNCVDAITWVNPITNSFQLAAHEVHSRR